ncbi:MAG: FkbM family methyltransferase [Candidatus Pelagibacter sp.]
MALPILFKPNKKYSLVRVGRDFDGGYLVGKDTILNSDTLVSFGINDDWSFERDFKNINSETKVICYDDKPILKYLFKKLIIDTIFLFSHLKVNKIFVLTKKIIYFLKDKKKLKFIKKKIAYGDLKEIVKDIESNFIFLKIDIEGFEYRILEDILLYQKKFTGIIIEFHDIDYHKDLIKNFINKLNLSLVHIHPNNNSLIDSNNDPTCVEITFEKKPIEREEELNFPNELDMRNNPKKKDVLLNFV